MILDNHRLAALRPSGRKKTTFSLLLTTAYVSAMYCVLSKPADRPVYFLRLQTNKAVSDGIVALPRQSAPTLQAVPDRRRLLSQHPECRHMDGTASRCPR